MRLYLSPNNCFGTGRRVWQHPLRTDRPAAHLFHTGLPATCQRPGTRPPFRPWHHLHRLGLPGTAATGRHTCSKGRPGTCLDNAVAETFFETLKVELIHRRPWPSRSDVVQAIFAAVETRYNPHRRHGSLGYLSPVAFEASQPSAPSAPKPMTVRQMGAGPTVAWPGGAIPPVSVAGTGVGRGGCRTREAIGPREGRAPVPGHQAAVWPYGGAVLGVWRRTVRPW
ncbi:MAG: hypothetical protein RL022_2660 [Chloroflexota bacterium]